MMNKYFDSIATPLNNVLYEMDPMGTCCKENELHDEYQMIAVNIAGWLIRNCPVEETIKSVFDEWFWVDCLSKEKLEQLTKETNEILDASGVHRRS